MAKEPKFEIGDRIRWTHISNDVHEIGTVVAGPFTDASKRSLRWTGYVYEVQLREFRKMLGEEVLSKIKDSTWVECPGEHIFNAVKGIWEREEE